MGKVQCPWIYLYSRSFIIKKHFYLRFRQFACPRYNDTPHGEDHQPCNSWQGALSQRGLHSRGGDFRHIRSLHCALHPVESALPPPVRIVLLDLWFDIQLHQRFVYSLLSSIFGGKKGALKYVIPHLKKYARERSDTDEKPVGFLDFFYLVSDQLLNDRRSSWSISSGPFQPMNQLISLPLDSSCSISEVFTLRKRPIYSFIISMLWLAAIMLSSIFITQTLFEIVLLSQEDVESIRTEVEEALESERGWTKAAIDKFYKLDSALREIGRFHGMTQGLLLNHNALSAVTISDSHRFHQLHYSVSLWLVMNWMMGSMSLPDIVSPLTWRPSTSILKSIPIRIDAICSDLLNCAAVILLIQSIPFRLSIRP